MKRITLLIVAAVSLAVFTQSGGPAFAAQGQPPSQEERAIRDRVDRLYALNGSVGSKTTLRKNLQAGANAQHMAMLGFLDRVLVEAGRATPRYGCYNGLFPDRSASKKLIKAKHAGDVFISTAGFSFFGHAGLYTSATKVIHAPGPGKKSVVTKASKVKVGCGTVVEAPWAGARKGAVSYALKNLGGRSYNIYRFWGNKYSKGSVNCSQLVWLAYKKGAKKDLDRNGGWAVYPWDLYHADMAYKVIL